MVVGNLRHIFFPSVCDLEKEHSVVVDDIEEDDNVDDERQQILWSGPWIAFVDLVFINFSANEDELNNDDGD